MSARASTAVVRWDLRVARAAAVATWVGFAIALVVTAATDEGGVAWLERIARSLAAIPACAGFGAWISLYGRRTRGELRAWETLGRSPFRAGLPAVVGAFAAAGIVAVAVTSARGFDATTFFPKATTHTELRWSGDAFVDDASGLAVLPDGTFSRNAAARAPATPASGTARDDRLVRVVVTIVLMLTSLSLSLLGARGDPAARELGAVGFLLLLTLLTFHLAAIGRAPLAGCALPPILLIVFSAFRYGAAR